MAKNTRQRLDYDRERVKINIAVAVKLCFKYQGLRSLPWGVRRSLATNPGFGSANLLGQTATAFFCAPISAKPIPPHPLLAAATVGPIPVAQHLVRSAKAGLV